MKIEKDIPFIAVGNGELDKNGNVGDIATCPNCGNAHKVEYGERVLEDGTKEPSKMLAYVSCPKNKSAYLIGIDGKLLK